DVVCQSVKGEAFAPRARVLYHDLADAEVTPQVYLEELGSRVQRAPFVGVAAGVATVEGLGRSFVRIARSTSRRRVVLRQVLQVGRRSSQAINGHGVRERRYVHFAVDDYGRRALREIVGVIADAGT